MNLSIPISRHRVIVFSTVALLSLLASLYAFLSVDVINNDGILYIETAEAFLAGGYSMAMEVFSWPLFPIIIAWLHQATGLTLEVSAYVVNAIMLVIVSVAFVRIYEEISVTNYPLWIPALIALTLPMINEYRAYVIRGHGYWAFSILALLFFIIYHKRSAISSAFFWQVFVIIGALFRIEGVVFILLAPFCLLFYKEKRGEFFRHYLRLNSIIIPAVICVGVIIFGHFLSMGNTSGALGLRLSYMVPSSLLNSIRDASTGVGALMPKLSSGEAMIVSVSGLVVLVIFKLVKNINLLYLAVIVAGRKRRWVQLSQESGIVLAFFALSALPVFVIAGNQLFVSSRYTVLSVTIFMVMACQYATYLFYKLKNEKRVLAVSAFLVLILLFFLDAIIHTGAIKGNIVSASDWVLQHIEPHAKVACNNKRFAFYTEKRCTYETADDEYFVDNLKDILKQGDYDYLLLWVKGGDSEIRDYLDKNKSLELLKAFKNKKNDEAKVYKIRSH